MQMRWHRARRQPEHALRPLGPCHQVTARLRELAKPVFTTVDIAIPHFQPWQSEVGWLNASCPSITSTACATGSATPAASTAAHGPIRAPPFPTAMAFAPTRSNTPTTTDVSASTTSGPDRPAKVAWATFPFATVSKVPMALPGDIGWCKDPYTSPSTLSYARKGERLHQRPAPGHEPRCLRRNDTTPDSHRAERRTSHQRPRQSHDHGLVDAAYLSAAEHRVCDPCGTRGRKKPYGNWNHQQRLAQAGVDTATGFNTSLGSASTPSTSSPRR